MSVLITKNILSVVAVLGLFGGYTAGAYNLGKSHERAKITKEADKAADRADDAVEDIDGLQDKADPIIVTETKTIIKQDRAAIRKLGEVEGQLKALRTDYEKLIKDIDSDWADGDLPDGVRQQITKIDELLSGL